jgi:ABC-type antimicrobial peptide transport system permease subunit
VTTFLFLFASVLLDITLVLTSGAITSALNVFFEAFIWATLLLVIILGVVVTSSTISMEILSRRKDIGLMKSIGTLMDTIYDHFMAQAMILLLVSVVLGITFGTFFYHLGLLWLASFLSGFAFSFVFPYLQVVIIAAIYIIAGYFSAQKPIYDIVQESPISALNPDIGMKVRRSGYLDSFGLPFKIATKATGRRFKGTNRVILSLFLSVSLASMLWIGGSVVETTTNAYVIRSMGSNVVAIGNPALLEQYYSAYSFTGTPLNESFSYLSSSDLLPADLISNASSLSGVFQVDTRLLAYADVIENPAIIYNPTTEEYTTVGGERSGSSLMVGLDWDNKVSDWYYEGETLSESTQVWIGGSMATTLFEDPLIQSLGVAGDSLAVKAITFDILNGGNVAFMPLEQMQTTFGVNGINLLLVQLDEYSTSLIASLQSLADDYGFGIYLQQEILDTNLETIDAFWALLGPLPVMALLSAFLSLMNYLLVSVFFRFRDYVIMRSIGASPSFIAKTIVAEGIDMGMKSGGPGVLLATFFSIYFLVPEAAVPSVIFLPASIVIMLAAIVIVVFLATIPVYIIFSGRPDLRVSEFSV